MRTILPEGFFEEAMSEYQVIQLGRVVSASKRNVHFDVRTCSSRLSVHFVQDGAAAPENSFRQIIAIASTVKRAMKIQRKFMLSS